jgi:hypothetical protein
MRRRGCRLIGESSNWCGAELIWDDRFGGAEETTMAGLSYEAGNLSANPTPPRNTLLRILDTLAEWQMRHSHSVISRRRPASADKSDDTEEHNQAA